LSTSEFVSGRRLVGASAPRRYRRDEGRPLGAAMQVEVPNHLKLLWTKAMVVSVEEKAYKMRQV
jgi:hypothetical protein